MYKNRTKCRGCGGEKLELVFDLGLQTLANDFVGPDGEHAGFAPLQVLVCHDCTLAQLSVVVNPQVLYSNYPYVTSRGETMRKHFERLAHDLKDEINGKLVMEIGSNDGVLLEYLMGMGDMGPRGVMGVEPAANLAATATANGVPTICAFFREEIASDLKAFSFSPDLIIARHMFAHVDDWHGFMRALTAVSHKDTLVAIEVPYALDQMERCSFDQIYHEHLSYLTVTAMDKFLAKTDWRLKRIYDYDIQGGSLLFLLGREDGTYTTHGTVWDFLTSEEQRDFVVDWKQFAYEAQTTLIALRLAVHRLVFDGKRVCAYGASAKSSVLIQAAGFTKGDIGFICDNTPAKQGKVSPGTDIPVVPECELTDKADAVICSAWNFFPEIKAKNPGYKGEWLNPLAGYEREKTK